MSLLPRRSARPRAPAPVHALPRLVLVILLIALALAAPRTHASPPVARLTLTHGARTQACPSIDELAQRVADKLGRPAFVEDAPLVLAVSLSRRGARYAAKVAVHDARTGAGRGSRELVADGPGCEALADTLAFTLALAVDPLALDRPPTTTPVASTTPRRPAEPEPHLTPERAPPEPSPPASTRPRRARPPPGPSLSAFGHVGFSAGLFPGPGLGPELGLALHTDTLSAALTAVTRFGASGTGPSALTSTALGVRLELVRGSELGAVLGLEALAWRADGPTLGGTELHLGALAGLQLTLSQNTQCGLQLAFPLGRQSLTRDGSTTWEMPPVYGHAWLGVTFGEPGDG